jgi:hypothetical protein
MKSLFLAGIAVLFLAPTAGAENVGSVFGAMTTAQATGRGRSTLSGGVGLADATSFLAGFDYGFTDKMDGRLRVGLVDMDGFDSQLALNGDVRWQVWNTQEAALSGTKKPFDMALGAFSEWMNVDTGSASLGTSASFTVFQLGFQMLGSYSFPMSNGTALVPYGRVNLRWENQSMEFSESVFGTVSASESHAAAGLNAGLAWEVTPHVDLLGEFQIDGNDGVFFGIDYGF